MFSRRIRLAERASRIFTLISSTARAFNASICFSREKLSESITWPERLFAVVEKRDMFGAFVAPFSMSGVELVDIRELDSKPWNFCDARNEQ